MKWSVLPLDELSSLVFTNYLIFIHVYAWQYILQKKFKKTILHFSIKTI